MPTKLRGLLWGAAQHKAHSGDAMMRGDGRLPAVHMDVGNLHATSCRFEGVDNTPMEEREAQIAELKAKRVKLEQWRERLARETLKEDLAAVKEEHSDSSPRHHISPAMAAARESVRDLHLPGHDGDEQQHGQQQQWAHQGSRPAWLRATGRW